MRDHVEALAVDLFFGRAVEVELDQFVGLAGERDGALADADLQGVAVVDDAEIGRAVAELDRLQIDLDAILDVDGRLPFAGGANLVLRVEIGPVLRLASAFIAPVGVGVLHDGAAVGDFEHVAFLLCRFLWLGRRGLIGRGLDNDHRRLRLGRGGCFLRWSRRRRRFLGGLLGGFHLRFQVRSDRRNGRWLAVAAIRRLDHRRLFGFGHFLLQQRVVGRLQLGGGLVRFLGDFGLALLGWAADLAQHLVVERAGTDR